MIKIEKMSKRFKEKVIFNHFDLEINDGDLVAIVGKSGCGKTTLLNILGLIDFDYDGCVLYDGVNTKQLKKSKRQLFIRNRINYLFQNYALVDDMSVEENMNLALYYEKLSKKEKEDIIKNALASVGLSGYEKKIIYTLSGGEQQRVSLARTMIKRGNIILADEPTGNLDDENREIVLKNLIALNKLGKTVIIVTHDEYIAQKCTRIIEL